jgi:hypothetical protein
MLFCFSIGLSILLDVDPIFEASQFLNFISGHWDFSWHVLPAIILLVVF